MIEHAVSVLNQPSSPLAGVHEAPPAASATMAPYVEEFKRSRNAIGGAAGSAPPVAFGVVVTFSGLRVSPAPEVALGVGVAFSRLRLSPP
jgi:hypothetical protein